MSRDVQENIAKLAIDMDAIAQRLEAVELALVAMQEAEKPAKKRVPKDVHE